MKNKRTLWISILFFALVFLFIGFKAFGPQLSTSAETLSKEEAKTLIEERYDGVVTDIVLKNNLYVMEMDRKETNYEIKLDAENGEVISFSKKGASANKESSTEQKVPDSSQVQSLTEIELKKKLLSEVPGELVLFMKINEQGKDLYKVIIKGKEKKTILKADPATGEILFQKSEKEAKVIITEDEAIKIALKQVKGQINDVDLETDDYLNYYLVEIDTQDEREATVQIHAITGEVLSITWDD